MSIAPMLFSDWPNPRVRGKQVDETVDPIVAREPGVVTIKIMQKELKVPKTPLAPDLLVPVPPQVGAAHPTRATAIMGA